MKQTDITLYTSSYLLMYLLTSIC